MDFAGGTCCGRPGPHQPHPVVMRNRKVAPGAARGHAARPPHGAALDFGKSRITAKTPFSVNDLHGGTQIRRVLTRAAMLWITTASARPPT
jgi:hypothetical protein